MKQVQIKTHEEVKFKGDELLNTRHLISMALDNAPAGGFSRKDIKERNAIEAIVESFPKGAPYILLEDSDHDKLKKIVDEMKWGIRHKFIEDFLDDMENAKSVSPADLTDLKPSENGQHKEMEVVN